MKKITFSELCQSDVGTSFRISCKKGHIKNYILPGDYTLLHANPDDKACLSMKNTQNSIVINENDLLYYDIT